jgi:hypothetical protein
VAGYRWSRIREAFDALIPNASREAPYGRDHLLAHLWSFFRGARLPSELVSAWTEAVQRAGLSDVLVLSTSALDLDAALSARSGRLRVEIETSRSSGQDRVAITIEGLGHRPGELELRAEGLGTAVDKAIGARELTVGDPAFDDGVYVRGWPPLVFALFDAETRRVVLRFLQDRIDVPGSAIGRSLGGRATVADGRLRVEMPDPSSAHPAHVADTLSGLLAVARRLARPADVAGRLAVNLGREPLVTVRARCLDVLVREYPDLRVTRRALRTALGDSTLEVRVQAAKALGDEGEPTLRAIASAEDGPDDIQARAIRALGERLSPELGESILHGALRRRRLPIAEACLEALGRHRKDDIVGPLAKVLAIERGALAAAAARALGTTGRPGAEAPLIDALGRLEGSAKLEAAVALGRVASAAAVAPLRRLERASRDAALRRAAREAIAQIQERLSGASPGQLSLADREVGQLSLTEDEAGRVSLSEEDGSAAEGDDHTRHRD